MPDLVNNVLTVEGDQEITGKHQIDELITDRYYITINLSERRKFL